MKRLLVEGPKKHIAPVLIIHNLKQLQELSSNFVDILMSSSLSYIFSRIPTSRL